MPSVAPLQPTLWRTCRVVANRSRLAMFGLLLEQPGQTVSAVAHRLHLPCCVASQYLRALEARGLLSARRVGRRVEYRPSATNPPATPLGLMTALRATFQHEPQAIEVAFRLSTAFTHPRRIQIYQGLQNGPRTMEQLRANVGLSGWALRRHLKKLETRGFVNRVERWVAATTPPNPLGRALAKAAAG